MPNVIFFLKEVVDGLLWLIIWLMMANAIMSWLIFFDVINLRNRIIRSIADFLDRITRPLLRPFRRIIPPIGGVDITPLIFFLVIPPLIQWIIDPFFVWLAGMAGATVG
jgi:YggT family protein